MNKIKVSADTILSIIQGVMDDEEINYTITDTSAPDAWQNKTVKEALNVEYYTYRHKPMDTEVIVRNLLNDSQVPSALYSLSRSFCILSIEDMQRVYSKDIDTISLTTNLEYWLQSHKVKLLEDMLEDLAVATTGVKIPVQIGNETRQVLMVVGKVIVDEIQEGTDFGEMAVCSVDISFIIQPDIVGKCDYTVEFCLSDIVNDSSKWIKIPISSLVFNSIMNQQTVPSFRNIENVESINISRVKSISITFEGYSNIFVENLIEQSLMGDIDEEGKEIIGNNDNNKRVLMRLTRSGVQYIYNCIVKQHTVSVQEDTGNEIHGLILTTRGIKDGNS